VWSRRRPLVPLPRRRRHPVSRPTTRRTPRACRAGGLADALRSSVAASICRCSNGVIAGAHVPACRSRNHRSRGAGSRHRRAGDVSCSRATCRPVIASRTTQEHGHERWRAWPRRGTHVLAGGNLGEPVLDCSSSRSGSLCPGAVEFSTGHTYSCSSRLGRADVTAIIGSLSVVRRTRWPSRDFRPARPWC